MVFNLLLTLSLFIAVLLCSAAQEGLSHFAHFKNRSSYTLSCLLELVLFVQYLLYYLRNQYGLDFMKHTFIQSFNPIWRCIILYLSICAGNPFEVFRT